MEFITEQADVRLHERYVPENRDEHSDLLHISLCKALYVLASFHAKIDREKLEEVFHCCDGIDVYSPEALADKMVRYLTEP
jgi:hypothetical protein